MAYPAVRPFDNEGMVPGLDAPQEGNDRLDAERVKRPERANTPVEPNDGKQEYRAEGPAVSPIEEQEWFSGALP